LETLFFSVLSNSPHLPLGLLRPFLKTNAKKGPQSSTPDPKGAPKGTPKNQIRQKGPPKRTRTNIKYKISNIKWINKHYMSNIKLFTLGEIKPNANIKYQM
jgi:hypothetical protein